MKKLGILIFAGLFISLVACNQDQTRQPRTYDNNTTPATQPTTTPADNTTHTTP